MTLKITLIKRNLMFIFKKLLEKNIYESFSKQIVLYSNVHLKFLEKNVYISQKNHSIKNSV